MKNNNDIKVTIINPPTKEESKERIKELCKFLSSTWHTEIKKL